MSERFSAIDLIEVEIKLTKREAESIVWYCNSLLRLLETMQEGKHA